MSFAIENVGLGTIIPAAISAGVFALSRRLLAAETAERYSAAVAFAAAFCVGYVLLPDGAELVPKRHWHWTPYLALAAAAIGPIALAAGLHRAERWLLYLSAAALSAWLLVPNWTSLAPSRSVYAALLAGYLFLLAALLEPLFKRFPSPTLPAVLTLASACVALLIAGFESLTNARLAGIAAAATAGCWVATCFSSETAVTRGLSLAWSVIVGGWAFICCIEPQRQLFGLLLAPAAPLALWCCVWGPLARLRGLAAAAVQTALVLVLLSVAAGLVVATAGMP